MNQPVPIFIFVNIPVHSEVYLWNIELTVTDSLISCTHCQALDFAMNCRYFTLVWYINIKKKKQQYKVAVRGHPCCDWMLYKPWVQVACSWCVLLEVCCRQFKEVSLKKRVQGAATSTPSHYRWHQTLVESLISCHSLEGCISSYICRNNSWGSKSEHCLLLIHERWCCKWMEGPWHT